MQTFIASTFVVALLALALGLYGITRSTQAMDMAVSARTPTAAADEGTADALTALEERIGELEAKTKALEEEAAAPAATADEDGAAPK